MQCIKGFTSPGCALQVLTKGLYFVMLSVCFQLPYAKVALHTEYMLRGITCPKGTWQHYVTTHLGSCEDIAMLYHCLLCVLFFLDTTKLLAITVISYHIVVLEFAPDIFGQTENKLFPWCLWHVGSVVCGRVKLVLDATFVSLVPMRHLPVLLRNISTDAQSRHLEQEKNWPGKQASHHLGKVCGFTGSKLSCLQQLATQSR